MANINLTALNMFSTAKDWTADSIANLDGKDAIKKVGDYGGALSALSRSSIEKVANNEMRTDDSVHQFMEVLIDFEGEKWCSKESGWNKQLADAVKAELRGKKCVMQNFDAPHELGAKVPELVGENGLPVVKVLTDDLIDELGPKILKEYFRT